jgi:hypothetical protein
MWYARRTSASVPVVIVISHLGIEQGVSRFTAEMVRGHYRIPVIRGIPEVSGGDGGQALAIAVAPSFTPPLPPMARPGRERRVRRRATAMLNGQQVWIDDVSRSARPRTLPSRVSTSSQPSRATKTAVTAAEP